MRLLLWLARFLGLGPRERTFRAPGPSPSSPAIVSGEVGALPEIELRQPSLGHDWGDTAALGEDQGWRFG